jgi:hypothetical protein
MPGSNSETQGNFSDGLGRNIVVHPNNDAVFQDNNEPIHTVGTVQSLLEENECELQPSSLASKITGSEHH